MELEQILELLARIGTDDAPTDEELAEARSQLGDLLKAALPDEGDKDLAAARDIKKAIDTIDSESKTRSDALAQEEEEARALLEGVFPEGEGDSGEGESSEEEEGAEAEAKEPVAVGASLGDSLKRTKNRIRPDDKPDEPSNVVVRAVGAAQGFSLSPDAPMGEIASLFDSTAHMVQQGRQALVHLEKKYPEDRILNSKQRVDNDRLIDAVISPQTTNFGNIGAAGGICAPLPADFEHPVVGDRGRPVRDALVQFQASRGGIRYAPAVTLADADGSVTYWDIATDESPGESTKACLVLDCEDELEAKVDAVVACLQVGNFQARFNPEFWRSRIDVALALHDRVAEQALLTELTTGSTAVTFQAQPGTIYSFLASVTRLTAGISSRLRLLPGTGYRVIAPQWARNALRSHMLFQDYEGNLDALAIADARIDSFFTSQNVSVTWSPDYQVFGAQGAGALAGFPNNRIDYLLYPEGTWMFLDGGTLDLGTEITDSVLNATNDRQMFVETFEKAALRGAVSYSVRVDVEDDCICPTSVTVEPAS